MAFLYLANKASSFICKTLIPTKNVFVPALTTRQKLVGGGGKFCWELFWLSYDVKLISALSVTLIPPVVCQLMEFQSSGSANGMVFPLQIAGLMSYPTVCYIGTLMASLIVLFRILRLVKSNKLTVLLLEKTPQ
jgi:hypothetical protein